MSQQTDPSSSAARNQRLRGLHVLPLKPPLRDGNSLRLLCCDRDYFPEILNACDHAIDEIRIETFIIDDDVVGKRVAQSLINAAERGVKVHFVVDGFGSSTVVNTLIEDMRVGGVGVRIFRPERAWWRLSHHRLRRLHRKLVVVDRHIAFVGGINLEDGDNLTEVGINNETVTIGPRYDFAVKLEGPSVQDIVQAMALLWWQVGPRGEVFETLHAWWWKKRLREYTKLPYANRSVEQSHSDSTDRVRLLLRDNVRFRRTIEGAYLKALSRAKHDVIIANAYFFPGHRFRQALLKAARRGVRVRLLLQGRVEYRLQHHATQALYEPLLRAGVEIYEYNDSYLHAKVAVIDGQWSTVGSSNIDPFSLLLAREANLEIYSPSFSSTLTQELEFAIQNRSSQVSLSDIAQRTVLTRCRHWLAYTILRIGVALTGQMANY
jgi:cardiolipin synthase